MVSTPVIPATWEVEVGGLQVEASPDIDSPISKDILGAVGQLY
jgi:hypothetical protein